MSNPDQLISVLTIVAVFLIILIFTLIGVWFFIVAKQKKNDGEKSEKNEATPSPNATYNLQSIMDFMEFEKVEDNMIIQKKGKYLMVLECQGINYDLMSEMEKDFLNYSAVRNLVSVKNTVEKEITFNKSPLSGRTKAYRRGELDEALESGKLKFEKGRVPLYASTSLIKATREDIQYSTAVDLESLIVEEATESFAVAEANEIINGTGVEQAEGILVNKDIEKIPTATTGALIFEDISAVYVALKGIYRKNAVFGANSVVIKMLMDLKDTSGRPIFFWNKPLTDTIIGDGNARIEATGTLFGKPLYEIPEMPDTVTTGKPMLVFGDFQTGYVLGNRVEMYMLRDENSDAKTGVVNFIFERYFGGAVKRAEAFKILKSK